MRYIESQCWCWRRWTEIKEFNGTLLSLYIMQCHRFNQSIQIWPHGVVFCCFFFLTYIQEFSSSVKSVERERNQRFHRLLQWISKQTFLLSPDTDHVHSCFSATATQKRSNTPNYLQIPSTNTDWPGHAFKKNPPKTALNSERNVYQTNTQQLNFCSSPIQYCHSSSLQRCPRLVLSSLEFEESFILYKDLSPDEVITE